MTTTETPAVPGPTTHLPRTEKYLRNRPFLLITMVRRPASGVKTEKVGWTEVTGNWATFEQPSLVDRVNSVHERNCSVIIDVINGKCVKNAFVGTPDLEVVGHYLQKYRQQVTEAMDVWLSNVANKVAAQNMLAQAKSSHVDAIYSEA